MASFTRELSLGPVGQPHAGHECPKPHVPRSDEVRFWPIVLQKSKVAAVQIFGENLKRKEVNDSHILGRATEVAHEFGARR
jgi:hypothetical protein